MLKPSNRQLLRARFAAFLLLSMLSGCALTVDKAVSPAPPQPYGAIPDQRQIAWHNLEFYGFLHFTTNTFTGKEWGYGDESPAVFNPTDFSAEQIVSTAQMAGMKGLILTCKHHDGFCLWPSRFTEHDIAASPFKNGRGDVVREIAEACKEHGLKFGVYLSPWDRNHSEYGRPAYIEYYRSQLRELLTNYGPVFEVWWDGANGGDGYYGGARETRRIDRGSYYGWQESIKWVRRLQPDACIFSDAGPDIRWVGNEKGIAGDPCWAAYTPSPCQGESKAAPGTTKYQEGTAGHRNGQCWMPAECDVSIRPGWFYHADQDDKVRSPENLLDLYYASVGRGGSFLLNVPPDRRGRIHENDVASLREFRRVLDATFAENLVLKGQLTASQVRGNAAAFNAEKVCDTDRTTYWSTDDGICKASLTVTFGQPITFNVVDIREYLPLGQRVGTWSLQCLQNGRWVEFAGGQSIGSRRLWRGDCQTTARVRLTVSGPVCPAISEFGLYAEPMVQ